MAIFREDSESCFEEKLKKCLNRVQNFHPCRTLWGERICTISSTVNMQTIWVDAQEWRGARSRWERGLGAPGKLATILPRRVEVWWHARWPLHYTQRAAAVPGWFMEAGVAGQKWWRYQGNRSRIIIQCTACTSIPRILSSRAPSHRSCLELASSGWSIPTRGFLRISFLRRFFQHSSYI